MTKAFQGKVILITGAASGIGAATAIHFSKMETKLSLIDISPENLKKIGNECQNNIKTSEVLQIEADMTKEEDLQKIIEETVKHFGKLDILINNAGILDKGSIECTSLKQFDKIFNINVRSVYELTRLAIPHLLLSQGNIVNLSSIAAIQAIPTNLAYSMSKATINHFTKNLALDLASRNVRVNSVNPGIICTNIYKNSGMSEKEVSDFLKNSKNPMGIIGMPEDVVNAIEFLANNSNRLITGIHLSVDGGRHIL